MGKGSNSLVSIILVNYNASQDTIECVESLKNITYKNIDIIVVDNKSREEERVLLKELEDKVKVIYSDENLGFSGGNNLGIKEAIKNKSEYILLLNNDTVVEKDFLEPLVSTAEEDKNVGIVGGKILFYDTPEYIWYNAGQVNLYKGNTIHYDNKEKDKGDREAVECTFITGCLQLIKTELISKIGMLSEEYFLYFEDTDYCMKAINNGYKLKVNKKSKIYHKVSKSTVENSDNYFYYFSRNRLMFIKNNFRGLSKISAYAYTYVALAFKYLKFRNINILKGISDFIKGKKGIKK